MLIVEHLGPLDVDVAAQPGPLLAELPYLALERRAVGVDLVESVPEVRELVPVAHPVGGESLESLPGHLVRVEGCAQSVDGVR